MQSRKMTEGNKREKIQKATQEKGTEVVLIYMPICELLQPSIGLSLLKSALSALGISTKILYYNLRFAKLARVTSYLKILELSNLYNQVGEWIFSGALFEQSKNEIENYIEEILLRPSQSLRYFLSPVSKKLIQKVLQVRDKVDCFLNECKEEVLSYHPRIIGFSSLFQQQVASLALAKRIKNHSPDTFIVFGGSNCEGIMGVEMIRQFPFIDAVVSGEGDIVFPELVQRLLKSKSLSDLQGVYTQTGPLPIPNNGHYPNAPLVQNMDALPYPDYDDFFDQFEKSRFYIPHPQVIPMETSRGCWWGEKVCCTFCGLNGMNMKYRGKSSQRVLNEIVHLSQKYPVENIHFVDNILNMDYFKDLLPELATRCLSVKFNIFVRSNLNKRQVQMLHNANFMTIMPGIESLSTPILRLMRKGVSQLQNIQLLKWCKEFGIIPFWNWLWGFPSEPAIEYERMARLTPLLVHLHPPFSVGHISLIRFSPNFEYADQFGFKDVTPLPAYHHVYLFEPEVVANLAFYFIYGYRSSQNVEEYVRPAWNEYGSWKKSYESSDLFFVDNGKHLFIWDQRPIAFEPPLTTLSGLQRLLYIECDSTRSISHLRNAAKSDTGRDYSQEEIEQILQPMMDNYLTIKDGDCYLSLAIPVGNYVPRKEIFERFQTFLQRIEVNKQHETLVKKVKVKEVSRDIKVTEEEIAFASGHVRSTGN